MAVTQGRSALNGDLRVNGGGDKGLRLSPTTLRTSARTTSINKASAQKDSQRYSPEWYTIDVVGGIRAGKTTLIRRQTKRVFEGSYQATTEELHSTTFPVDNLPVTLHIQDRGYARISIARLARNPAHGLLLVFSVRDRSTFAYLQTFAQIVSSGRFDMPSAVIMVGTHSDCADSERQVSGGEAAALAAQLGVAYVETSALSHRGAAPFYHIVRMLRQRASPESEMMLLKAAHGDLLPEVPTFISRRPATSVSSSSPPR